ncbi:MAG TPA: alkaline phosphatase, partial [bacterium]|nr:alkaline phosphatase [bacterium]
TGPDVMLSGGLRYFLPRSANSKTSPVYTELVNRRAIPVTVKSKRKDTINVLEYARSEAGYELAFSREDLNAAHGPKVLGLFNSSGMPDAIDETWQRSDPARRWPTLDEMTTRALDILDNDPDGFFLMVEAGQIDWAEHNQDAGQLLHEMLRLDRTLEVIRTWATGRDDTVIIITADHDTGGFTMTYTANDLPNTPNPVPGTLFRDRDYQPGNNYGRFDVFDRLYDQKMSSATLLFRFDKLPEKERTPQALAAMIEQNTGVSISIGDALRILRKRENPYYVEGDDALGIHVVPDMGDDQAFFTTSLNMLCGLIARRTGIDQNITWSTGTHSATPVPVIVLGPERVRAMFPGVMHLTDLGKIMKRLVDSE